MESTLALLNEEIVYYYHLSFINHVFHSVFLSWGLLDACLCNSWRGIPRDLFLLSLTSLSIQPTVCVTLSLFLFVFVHGGCPSRFTRRLRLLYWQST